MANPVFFEDVVAGIIEQYPFGMHFETTDFNDVLEAQEVAITMGGGVVCDSIGLPIDQSYAEFSIENFGSVHFDMHVRSQLQLQECINALC